ncbi:hypothetical protein BDZ97DRAFT_1766337 [Flammula alnicola]|nr:hypothetical protein BDZ97DRAFT_1766337 [Flammula alnicola]
MYLDKRGVGVGPGVSSDASKGLHCDIPGGLGAQHHYLHKQGVEVGEPSWVSVPLYGLWVDWWAARGLRDQGEALVEGDPQACTRRRRTAVHRLLRFERRLHQTTFESALGTSRYHHTSLTPPAGPIRCASSVTKHPQATLFQQRLHHDRHPHCKVTAGENDRQTARMTTPERVMCTLDSAGTTLQPVRGDDEQQFVVSSDSNVVCIRRRSDLCLGPRPRPYTTREPHPLRHLALHAPAPHPIAFTHHPLPSTMNPRCPRCIDGHPAKPLFALPPPPPANGHYLVQHQPTQPDATSSQPTPTSPSSHHHEPDGEPRLFMPSSSSIAHSLRRLIHEAAVASRTTPQRPGCIEDEPAMSWGASTPRMHRQQVGWAERGRENKRRPSRRETHEAVQGDDDDYCVVVSSSNVVWFTMFEFPPASYDTAQQDDPHPASRQLPRRHPLRPPPISQHRATAATHIHAPLMTTRRSNARQEQRGEVDATRQVMAKGWADAVTATRQQNAAAATLQTEILIDSNGAYYEVSSSSIPNINANASASAASNKLHQAQISLNDCLACSGCITSPESVLIMLQSHTDVLNFLASNAALANAEDRKIPVISITPQSLASLAAFLSIDDDAATAGASMHIATSQLLDIDCERDINNSSSSTQLFITWSGHSPTVNSILELPKITSIDQLVV